MSKPKNPVIAQKKLEATMNKKMDEIRDLVESKSYTTSKIAFLAIMNYYANYTCNESLFDLCDLYKEIYEKIRYLEDLNEIINTCNQYEEIVTLEDLQTAYPEDFMSYSSD